MSGVLGILTRKMSWILSEILESPIRSHVTMGTYMVASRLAFPLYLRIPLAFVSGVYVHTHTYIYVCVCVFSLHPRQVDRAVSAVCECECECV